MSDAPHGSWPSPISARMVAAGATGVGGVAVRTSTDRSVEALLDAWWLELRAEEKGRAVLVRRRGDADPVDVLTPPYSARTRVHEYGGGAWWLGRDHAWFANWDDQRLYRVGVEAGGGGGAEAPEPVTAAPDIPAGWRYADGAEHPDGTWVACVREDHHGVAAGKAEEPVNQLVAVVPGVAGAGPGEAEVTVIAEGSDFVAAPRFSPDGRWLSWIRWNHPDMPWDATELCAAPVFDGARLGNVKVVAGGPVGADGADGGEAIHGADWTSDGRLVFSSDRIGWWNLHHWTPGGLGPTALTELEGSEIGAPQWVFGTQRWTELADGTLAVIETEAAADRIHRLDPDGGMIPIETVGRTVAAVGSITGSPDGRLAIVASGPESLPAISLVDVSTGEVGDLRPADELGVDPAWFSRARPVSFPSGDRTAHAFFYPPTGPGRSAGSAGSGGASPPLIVMGHGGPTSHATPSINLKIQYWTSRGFAVVDVNYGGSTGFGRAYRQLLQGSWGLVDVEDCIAAAGHLAGQGLVDGDRLAIRGGSAGGFTVLAALVASDVFSAGTSLYGVADLTALAADTHKFESRYLDGLVGPYPERRDLYEDRSPINHTDRFETPLLVLQGLEDEIVPPNQSEAIVAALAAKGIAHAYVPFEGEQHGFRQADNIVRSLEVELWFYGRVYGFAPHDEIEAPEGAVGLD